MRVKQAKKLKVTTRDRQLVWINHYINNDFGIWIECTVCKKWRKSYGYSESHEVPGNWCCSMGTTDGKKGSCEDPEEKSEEEYFEYCPGSLVWARLDGYPWWPGMVDENPDIEEYFYVDKKGNRFYNVTFLDERVTHAWIPDSCISSFLNPPPRNSRQYEKNRYSSAIKKAEERAQTALKMTIKERLRNFSFVYLYKGKWPLADDFDGTEEEDTDKEANPLDITDILLQEIDDLGSMNSSDTDDQEHDESDEHGFDYLKKKSEIESSKTKKRPYKTSQVHNKTKKTSGTEISKFEENIIFTKSLINKESSNPISKKKDHSFIEKETDFLKRSQTSKLSRKKLKTENNSLQSKIDTLGNADLKKITSEKEHLSIEILKQNIYDKSASNFSISTTYPESVEIITIEEECTSVVEAIPTESTKSNEVNSDEIDKESNSCLQFSPLKVNAINERVSEVNSISHTETDTIDETEEKIFQNTDSKYSNSFITEESNHIIANKARSLDMDNSNYSEKMDIFLSHLDECITNVINCARNETELPTLQVKVPKQIENGTKSSSMSIKTPKKNVNASENSNCETVRNVNEPEVVTKGFDQISSDMQKISSTKLVSRSKDSKPKKNNNENSSTVVKKNVKLVGYDKFPPKKVLTSEHLIDSPIKECNLKAKVNEGKSNGNILKKNKLSSTENKNILNTGNKMKPDFKAPLKRPFKNSNLALKDIVANNKQYETQNGRSGSEENSFQEHWKNTSKSDAIPLYHENNNEPLSVVDKPFIKHVMKTPDESNIEAATKENVGSKNSDAVEFTCDKIGKDIETVTIDDKENKNSDQNSELEDKEDTDDCFFYIDV